MCAYNNTNNLPGEVKAVDAKATIQKIVFLQLLMTLAMVALFGYLQGVAGAWSASVGGLICLLTTLCFARQVFGGEDSLSAAETMKRFCIAEVVKLLLTALLFAFAIGVMGISFLPLMLTYLLALTGYWLILPFSLHIPVKT